MRRTRGHRRRPERPLFHRHDQKMERILIVRLSAMGDLVNSLPVAAALRKAKPDAVIDWVVEERWSELLCVKGTSQDGARSAQKPLVDTIYTVNTRKWRDN